jgi:hypothetical protein
MGLPYSRQINAAFEEVTPLVAAGFKVLRTTRNISILLAIIQVLTVFFLFLILLRSTYTFHLQEIWLEGREVMYGTE